MGALKKWKCLSRLSILLSKFSFEPTFAYESIRVLGQEWKGWRFSKGQNILQIIRKEWDKGVCLFGLRGGQWTLGLEAWHVHRARSEAFIFFIHVNIFIDVNLVFIAILVIIF